MEENNMLYHGSITPRINKICANSTLHGSDTKVVYLSDNFPYTLFYIWDSEQNIRQGKYHKKLILPSSSNASTIARPYRSVHYYTILFR